MNDIHQSVLVQFFHGITERSHTRQDHTVCGQDFLSVSGNLYLFSQKYQLSQEEAQQIADISDNVEYTKNVMLVLQRLGLGFWEFPQGTVTEETSAPNTEEAPAQLPDPLPEEEEIQQ